MDAVVLLRVPERAAVDRVDGHHAVVTPAAGFVRLRAGTDDDVGFSLRHGTRGVGGQPAGVADRRRQLPMPDTLNPRAMFPDASIAALAIQR